MKKELRLQVVTPSDPVSSTHPMALSTRVLVQQNHAFQRTSGVSVANRDQGFRPAFMDQATGTSYLSRFADGRVVPLHVLEGLPDELVADRDLNGQVLSAKDNVVVGFLRDGLFYTREQAALAVSR